ncbi:MAG: hypothetical protein Aurels2KO_55640 [Aureliella sp.]
MKLLCLFVLAVFPSVVVAQEDDSIPAPPEIPAAHPAQPIINEAAAAFQAGNGNRALELFRQAAEEHPDLTPGEIMFAQLAFASGQSAAGREAIELAAIEHPDAPEVWNALGEIATRQGRNAEALLLFEKASSLLDNLSKFPARSKRQQVAIHRGIALVAQKRKDWKTAELHLRDWIELDKRNSVPWKQLALVFFVTERFELAEQTLTNLRTFDKQQPVPEVSMGVMFQNTGKLAEAEAVMKAAIEKNPDDASTQLAVAKWALTADKPEILHGCASKANELAPGADGVDALMGMAERFAARPEKAEEIFAKMLRDRPTSFDAMNGLALSLLEQESVEKHRRALQHAQLLAKTNPDPRTPRGRAAGATLAWALFKNGQIKLARKAMNAAITTGQVSPEIGYFAAKIFAHEDADLDLAIKLLSAALESPIGFPERSDAKSLLSNLTGK